MREREREREQRPLRFHNRCSHGGDLHFPTRAAPLLAIRGERTVEERKREEERERETDETRKGRENEQG